MANLNRDNMLTRSALAFAVLSVSAIGIIAVLGFSTTATLLAGIAFAQQATTMGGSNNTAITNTSSTSGNSTLSGIISSTQLNEAGAPQWLTAGSWTLVTDKPVFGSGNQTIPTVKSFDAVLVMTAINNGTMTHSHHISNFKQIEAFRTSANSTFINGTMTVQTEKETTENVPGFLDFQNDRMSVWVNPGMINSHFGPTPINGMILNSQLLQEIRSLESPSLQQGVQQNTTATSGSITSSISNNTISGSGNTSNTTTMR